MEALSPVVIRQPILPTPNWEANPQAPKTSGNESGSDSTSAVAAVDRPAEGAPPIAPSLPVENEAYSAQIAFGLRLTPPAPVASLVPFRSELQMSPELIAKPVSRLDGAQLSASPPAGGIGVTNSAHDPLDPSAPNSRESHETASATGMNPIAIRQFPASDLGTLTEPRSCGNRFSTEPANPQNSIGVDISKPKPSSTTISSESGSVPLPRVRQIGPATNYPILADDFVNRSLVPKKSDAGTRDEPGNMASDTESKVPVMTLDTPLQNDSQSPAAQLRRWAQVSDGKELGTNVSRPEFNAESKPEPRSPGTESGPSPNGLDATEAKPAPVVMQHESRPAESETLLPRATSSQAVTVLATQVQPATPESTASQTPVLRTPQQAPAPANSAQAMKSGETPQSAAATKSSQAANPAAANPAAANQPGAHPAFSTHASTQMDQPIPNQAATSELTRSTASSRVALGPHSESLSTNNTSELDVKPAPQPQSARQISLKLTGEDATKVSVDVTEKFGKVQISVRSADPDLTKSLRSDLGDLVGRLENKGFKTEAWVPAPSRHVLAASAEQSDSRNNSSYPRDSGAGTQPRQNRQGQQGSNQRQQARWITQLKETIGIEETRTENQ